MSPNQVTSRLATIACRHAPAWTPRALFDVLTRHKRSGITPILCYHAIGNPDESPLVSGQIHRVDAQIFWDQIRILKKHFDVVPIDELADRKERGLTVRGLSAITFDDGYLSVLKQGLPILEDLKAPASFFLATGMIGGRAMWRDKIRFLLNKGLVKPFLDRASRRNPVFATISAVRFYRATKDPAVVSSKQVDEEIDEFFAETEVDIHDCVSGVYCSPSDLKSVESSYLTFGNHTHSHYVLSSMSRGEQVRDIEAANEVIRDLKLPRCGVLAAPFGGLRDVNTDTWSVIAETGLRGLALAGSRIRDGISDATAGSGEVLSLHRFLPISRPWFWAGP